MCIRDRIIGAPIEPAAVRSTLTIEIVEPRKEGRYRLRVCLLYTSDAADERSSVDLGGRRILKKKKNYDEVRVTV